MASTSSGTGGAGRPPRHHRRVVMRESGIAELVPELPARLGDTEPPRAAAPIGEEPFELAAFEVRPATLQGIALQIAELRRLVLARSPSAPKPSSGARRSRVRVVARGVATGIRAALALVGAGAIVAEFVAARAGAVGPLRALARVGLGLFTGVLP